MPEPIKTSLIKGRSAATISGVLVVLIPSLAGSFFNMSNTLGWTHITPDDLKAITAFLIDFAGLYCAVCAYRSRSVSLANKYERIEIKHDKELTP